MWLGPVWSGSGDRAKSKKQKNKNPSGDGGSGLSGERMSKMRTRIKITIRSRIGREGHLGGWSRNSVTTSVLPMDFEIGPVTRAVTETGGAVTGGGWR